MTVRGLLVGGVALGVLLMPAAPVMAANTPSLTTDAHPWAAVVPAGNPPVAVIGGVGATGDHKRATSGRRSFQLQRHDLNGPAAVGAAADPATNIPPYPVIPARCAQAYQSTDCTNSIVAALNNARRVMGLPSYLLPANFALMTPGYQFLVLSNADRILAGRTPITAFNADLNTIAQRAANASADPFGPTAVHGIAVAGWTGNWAGGMTALEAYYDWMYFDGFGSNNVDCNTPVDVGCWGHRENTLWNFGSAEVAMGIGADFTGTSYGTSWTELYWAYSPTGPRIPRLPAVLALTAAGGPAGGGTRVTLTGYGLETASSVTFGSRSTVPIAKSARSMTVNSPAGAGVVPVRVTGDGGIGVSTPIASFSYLAAPGAGSYVPLAPARLLDTRIGLGAARARVGPVATVRLRVSGRGGVPATGVSAVVLDVVAVAPTTPGSLIVFGDGAATPGVSNLNYVTGKTVANLVVSKVGSDGRVALYNGSHGLLDLVADVSGYYLAGTPTAAGSFVSVGPTRLLDTRVGLGAARAKLAGHGTAVVAVAGRGGIPATGVSAAIVNVTAVGPIAPGFLTVYGHGAAQPSASNLNVVAGLTVANLVLTPVGADGRISIYNGSVGAADVLADVVGYVRGGNANTTGAIVPVAPARIFDSRSGVGVGTFPPYNFAPPPGQLFVVGGYYRTPLLVSGRSGVPAVGVTAVVLNVTVVNPAAPGFYTVYPDGRPTPVASNVNFVRGQTVPNLVIVPVPRNGLINLYNGAPSYTSLIVDVSGYILG